MTNTVACVLRSGKDFSAGYVHRLYAAVREHWPKGERLDFVALTDTPIDHPEVREIPLLHQWPGYWAKLELFRPDVMGDLLYFDLDTMITGPLDDLARFPHHAMLRSFKWPRERVASGVMVLPEAVRPVIWERWMLDPDKWMRVHRWPNPEGHMSGDQGFMQETWERSGWGSDRKPTPQWAKHGILRLQRELPRQICSYKRHVRKAGKVPPGARVVCFHGDPRPHAIGWRLPGND